MYNRGFWAAIQYIPALLKGARVSLEMTLLVLLFGTIWGICLSYIRSSKDPFVRGVTVEIINIFISLPVLALLFWIYYALPTLIGFSVSAFKTAIIALSINLAVFASDIFSSALHAVPRSQIESWIMFNFSRFQILREIIIPQIIKVIIGPLSWRYVETIKLTSLASIISVNELLHAWQNIISLTYKPLEIYTLVAIIYMIIIFPLIIGLKQVERKYTI